MMFDLFRRFLYQVVAPWQAVLQLFDVHSEAVQHAGLAPAKGGFQWFNFMCVQLFCN